MPEPLPDPVAHYQARRTHWQAVRDAETARSDRLSLARLAVVAAAGLAAWLLPGPWWIWGLAGVVGFAVLVARHKRIERKVAEANRLARAAGDGLARLSGDFESCRDEGVEFRQAEHPYADDLDLFGPSSVYQRLTVCHHPVGRRTLADWLTVLPPASETEARREAATELAGRGDVREAHAKIAPVDRDDAEPAENVLASSFAEWVAAPPQRVSAWEKWLANLLGLAGLAAILGWMFAGWSLGFVGLVAVAQLLLVARRKDHLERMLAASVGVFESLRTLARLIELLETTEFAAPLLVEQKRRVLGGAGDETASATIRELAADVHRLRNGLANHYTVAVAIVVGRPLAWLDRLERWRERHGGKLPGWSAAVGVFEATLSLARWEFEHPGHAAPVIDSAGTAAFEADGLRHPLLGSAAVANDVAFGLADEGPQLIVISGSNMSGKSTLLRAIGLGVVFARMGGVVAADRFRCSRLLPGTAMRASDSLASGESLFYAVVRRLKLIVDLAGREEAEAETLLFLLDEILQGTNSHDRRVGASRIIEHLLRRGATGLVTTHDLALTAIVDEVGSAENRHFVDTLRDGKMQFDYQLRPGVVQKSNALELMRTVGLPVCERDSEPADFAEPSAVVREPAPGSADGSDDSSGGIASAVS